MSTLAARERAALADLFDAVGPQQPTLCEGWDTGDLAAHLIVRESEVLGSLGTIVPFLEPYRAHRMARVLDRSSWTAVVDRFRHGTRLLRAVPGLDQQMNGLEFFVHHEDVRRAGDSPAAPRNLLVSDEVSIWRQIAFSARIAVRELPQGVGLRIENVLDDEGPLNVRPGARMVTLVGKPSEVALWLMGRRRVADVEVIGDADVLRSISR
ncbi:TIGR03085 family metal-binding protein [Propionibacteriaceae bacterium G1746]|uniref:TIGR03085 family metal-binding protein n=1 Tax=Aestuariimicrobium sp. G57 TaxID=3418485 RepID=UPI003C219C85